MIGTVTRGSDLTRVDPAVVPHAVALDAGDPAKALRAVAPEGVNRVIEVTLSDNAGLDAAVVANDAVIAAYASRADQPQLPFWPLLFANVTLRLLGSDDFPAQAKRQAARDLTAAAAVGALKVSIAARYPLQEIAKAPTTSTREAEAASWSPSPTDIPRRTPLRSTCCLLWSTWNPAGEARLDSPSRPSIISSVLAVFLRHPFDDALDQLGEPAAVGGSSEKYGLLLWWNLPSPRCARGCRQSARPASMTPRSPGVKSATRLPTVSTTPTAS